MSEENRGNAIRIAFVLCLLLVIAFVLYRYAYITKVNLKEIARCRVSENVQESYYKYRTWDNIGGDSLIKLILSPDNLSSKNIFSQNDGLTIKCDDDIGVIADEGYFLRFGCEIDEFIIYKTRGYCYQTSYAGPVSVKLHETGDPKDVTIYLGDYSVLEK